MTEKQNYCISHTLKKINGDFCASLAVTHSHLSCQFNDQSQLEYNKAKERRRQLKEDHGRLIQELVEKMERDLAREQLAVGSWNVLV